MELVKTHLKLLEEVTIVILKGKVCLVTGGSRGLGRGIAIELARSGCFVYITGRTVEGNGKDSGLKGNLTDTANYINTKTSGKCKFLKCDHFIDEEVDNVINTIIRESGKIDVLVNNCLHTQWHGQRPPFWKQDMKVYDSYHNVGTRSHLYCATKIVPHMLKNSGKRKGLIANISSLGEERYLFNVAYGTTKAALGKMSRDIAHEFKKFKTGITCVDIWPGLVKNERNVAHKEGLRRKFFLDINKFESVYFTGRSIVNMLNDKNIQKLNGKTLRVGDLAHKYNFTDIDGRIPPRELTLKFLWTQFWPICSGIFNKFFGKKIVIEKYK